jgi:hypothetical protein
MKFNIVSQNQRFVHFCNYLKEDGHEVVVVNGEFSDCDVMIYDTQFKQQLSGVKDCVRIELTDTQKGEDFALSFGQVPGAYQIQDTCTLLGKGEKKDELACDLAAVDQDLNKVKFIDRYMNLNYKTRFFGNNAINTYNYCGVIRGRQISDVYASAKVSICLNKQSVLMALESGGNVITDGDYGLGLFPEQVFYDEDDFYEKVDDVLNGNYEDVSELRNRLLKEKSPFRMWANIFKEIGLNKVSDRLNKKNESVLNALYFK